MEYLPLSFIAGVLTILAPCMLPLLPILFTSAVSNGTKYTRTVVITLSLGLAIILFTLLLKASTLLIAIDPGVWTAISGTIIFLLGVTYIFPDLWTQVELKLNLSALTSGWLQKSNQTNGLFGAALTGFALGPVFTSCSPTYALIVAVILPQDFAVGMLNLFVYVLGLLLVIGLVVLLGQRFTTSVRWLSDPNGTFKKILGVVLVVLGLAIATGLIKEFEIFLLDQGWANGIIDLETNFARQFGVIN